jgi:CSLREA domain-containing protein
MTEKRLIVRIVVGLLTLVMALAIVHPTPVAKAATITVDRTADDIDINGNCTLREAIIAANTDTAVDNCTAGSGSDTIFLLSGSYMLSIPGAGENAGATGDLDITDDLTITGGSNIYLPLALKDYIGMGTAPAVPTLSPIDNIDGDGNYTVSWSTSSGATAYTLQGATNPTFTDSTTAYSGPNNSSIVNGKPVGTYYYRVNASNTYGTSSWSNTEKVLVSITPSGPEPGHYTGTPSVSFDVTEEQQVCNFDITIPFNGGTCRKILDGCADIVDDKFSFIKDFPPFTVNDYEITGTFDTQTHALGDYAVWYCDPTLYFTPFEGTWEASK